MLNFTMQVRDRFNLTKQALETLAYNTGLKEMTVTVLDDRSLPETRDFVIAWCFDHGAYYIRNDDPLGTGPLRNMVMEESRKHFGQGDYVAPHDNDTYYNPACMRMLVECYKEAHRHGFRLLGAYGHPFHRPISRVPINCYYGIPVQEGGGTGQYEILEVQALATQSMMMRWDVWDKYGPFCATPVDKTCQSEDVDFTNKIRKDGFKLGVVYPHLVNATALKNTFGEPGPGWEYVKAECPEGVVCE